MDFYLNIILLFAVYGIFGIVIWTALKGLKNKSHDKDTGIQMITLSVLAFVLLQISKMLS